MRVGGKFVVAHRTTIQHEKDLPARGPNKLRGKLLRITWPVPDCVDGLLLAFTTDKECYLTSLIDKVRRGRYPPTIKFGDPILPDQSLGSAQGWRLGK